MFVLKRIFLPALLRQHQQSDNNLTFLNTYSILCCVVVGCVSRSVAVRLNICSKLVRNTTFFFRVLHWFCLISNLSQTQFDGPQRCKDASPTYSSFTINHSFFVSSINSRSLGVEFFRSLYTAN